MEVQFAAMRDSLRSSPLRRLELLGAFAAMSAGAKPRLRDLRGRNGKRLEIKWFG